MLFYISWEVYSRRDFSKTICRVFYSFKEMTPEEAFDRFRKISNFKKSSFIEDHLTEYLVRTSLGSKKFIIY